MQLYSASVAYAGSSELLFEEPNPAVYLNRVRVGASLFPMSPSEINIYTFSNPSSSLGLGLDIEFERQMKPRWFLSVRLGIQSFKQEFKGQNKFEGTIFIHGYSAVLGAGYIILPAEFRNFQLSVELGVGKSVYTVGNTSANDVDTAIVTTHGASGIPIVGQLAFDYWAIEQIGFYFKGGYSFQSLADIPVIRNISGDTNYTSVSLNGMQFSTGVLCQF